MGHLERGETDEALEILEGFDPSDPSLAPHQRILLLDNAAQLTGSAYLADGRPDLALRKTRAALERMLEREWPEIPSSLGSSVWHDAIDSVYVELLITSAECQLAVGERGDVIEAMLDLLDHAEEWDGEVLPWGREGPIRLTTNQRGGVFLLLGGAHGMLAYLDAEHVDPARGYLAEARLLEGVRSRTRRNAALRAAMLELDEGRLDEARGELSGAGDPLEGSPTERALRYALQARLEVLEEQPREVLERSRRELDRSLTELCDVLRAKERSPGKTASIRYDRERLAVEEVLRLSDLLDGPEAALERLLELQAAVLYRPLVRTETSWLEQVERQLVPPDGGILLYFPGARAVHLFLLDRDGAERVELADEYKLRELIQQFNRAVTAAPGRRSQHDLEDLQEGGRALHDALLPETVRARLARWSSLTIVATGRLWGLHFRALPFEGGLLGERKAVGFLPSLALGLELARRGEVTWGEKEILLLGAPPSTDGRPLLKVTSEEWKRLLHAYFPERQLLFTGPEASAAVLSSVELGSFPVVQFLAHGVLKRDEERPWRLALADGMLASEDVEALPAGPAGLVILSSCESTGPLRVGAEEITTMGGTFLWKGARDVILSEAEATLGASLALGGFLHRAIATGASPAEALRCASAALVQEGGELADPYHHGIVRVVGLAHRPYFEPRDLPELNSPWRWARWGFPVVLLMLLLLLVLARRRSSSGG